MIAERKLQDTIDQQIQHDRKSKRYRRLGYYFFEKEIQSDIRKSLESDFISSHHLLIDPEYQACIARSSLWKNILWWIVWDDITFLINNYIFSQDVFLDTQDADVVLSDQLIHLLKKWNNPWFLNDSSTWMSDIVLQCRRARADVQLVQSIVNGSHTYKSFLKSCSEYIGQYVQLPRLFEELWLMRSSDVIVSLLDEATQQQLQWLLQPQYQVVCHILNDQDIQAYGYIDIANTPYSTWVGKFWQWWTNMAWYSKIIITALIIFISWWFWWWALIILPIVRWLLAVSRSISQYLELLKTLLSQWYTRYSDYNTTYIDLYDAMIDPDQSPKNSISAQHIMTRRYDIIPFSGHELVWDATQYAKILFDAIIWSLSHGFESSQKNIAMISAVHNRWKNNNLSLLIVKDGQYPEQVLYRFESLLQLTLSLVWSVATDTHYNETYDIVDEQISIKKYNFRFWTFRNALMDGVTVTLSSAVLWWMWSYLRNRSVTGTSTFAAGPGLIGNTVTQSDGQLLLDSEVLSAMKNVMKPEDLTRFVDTIVHHGQSNTLWDTMVNLFWEKQWNIYTNNLMDHWWRIDMPNGESALFATAFDHGMPTSASDAWWSKMLHFLHRVYGYDNLQEYESLINKSWLSETIRGLKDGSVSLEDFEKLDIKQREIVSQAMFYHVPKESLSQLFLNPESNVVDMGTTTLVQTGNKIEINQIETGWKIVETGSILTTGSADSLSIWQKILDILGWGTPLISGDVIVEQSGAIVPNIETTGDITSIPTWDVVVHTGSDFTKRWWQYFTETKLVENTMKTWDKFVESGNVFVIQPSHTGDVMVNHTGSISSSWWMDHLSSRWYNLTHPSYIMTETGWKIAETGTKLVEDGIQTTNKIVESGSLTQSGSILHSGSVATSWWFEQFVTWIKGTAPVKTGSVDLSGLVNTGKIEQVLSGINPIDLQEQVTWAVQQQSYPSSSPLHLSQFTWPVLKRDKKVE
jgi:hypothetical protein